MVDVITFDGVVVQTADGAGLVFDSTETREWLAANVGKQVVASIGIVCEPKRWKWTRCFSKHGNESLLRAEGARRVTATIRAVVYWEPNGYGWSVYADDGQETSPAIKRGVCDTRKEAKAEALEAVEAYDAEQAK